MPAGEFEPTTSHSLSGSFKHRLAHLPDHSTTVVTMVDELVKYPEPFWYNILVNITYLIRNLMLLRISSLKDNLVLDSDW